jgi:hypothetical protein
MKSSSVRLHLDRPGQARLDRVWSGPISAPRRDSPFPAAGFQSRGSPHSPGPARPRHQRLVDGDGDFHRHVQLPAQFADIGHAQRQDRASGDRIQRAVPKGKPAFDRSSGAMAPQGCPAPWAPSATGRHSRGHIAQLSVAGQVAGNPVEIMGGKAGAGDDVEFVLAPGARRSDRIRCRPCRSASGYRSGCRRARSTLPAAIRFRAFAASGPFSRNLAKAGLVDQDRRLRARPCVRAHGVNQPGRP